ncbi:hypothetical protein V565_094150 [Rhizoctonia solani 123E]|uniref:F-box domain-containing protein n=1 Tax=Rhizoctonia solani 123E TaxID=1423351 RepID=A0A074RYR2_9AGAM|nr:hypothetical protein V565_094150 [Rhizoctonia solani 123E]
MFELNKSSVSTVRQWEEAGTALASALSKYLDLCALLGPNLQKDEIPAKAMAMQIDSALETFHTKLEQRVAESRSVLARTRNQLLPPVSCLSNEILSEIFTYVVFDPVDPSNPVSMNKSLVDIYQSLHSLLGVCSTWRDVVLARGSFWSIIPIVEPRSPGVSFHNGYKPRSTGISLGRSGSTNLHLAGIISAYNYGAELIEHIPRFGSINIISSSTSAISHLLSLFLGSGIPLKVSSLSLCLESNVPPSQIPPQRTSLSSCQRFQQKDLEDLVESLSVIRLSDVLFDWDRVKLSHRLVELELRNLNLGSDSNFISLLISLSSATELLTLKLIGVTTYPDPVTPQITTTKPIISLPKLQTMVARNLQFNALDLLLSSITSRSHQLTLHLTRRSVEIPLDNLQTEEVTTQHLVDLFRQVTVNTLLLENFEGEGYWLSAADICELLWAMPNLETLRMHIWKFTTEFCEMIQRPNIPSECPQIKNMYLSQARIRDDKAFMNMVASYFKSLERMELAGSVIKGSQSAGFSDYLQGQEPIVAWLLENVPNFVLKTNQEVPPEFRAPVWQLW